MKVSHEIKGKEEKKKITKSQIKSHPHHLVHHIDPKQKFLSALHFFILKNISVRIAIYIYIYIYVCYKEHINIRKEGKILFF